MMNHKRQQPEFSVRVLGDEVIGGLHCRHIQASTTGGQRFDIWTSRDIPGYEKMRDLYVQSLKAGSDKLWKDIKEAGAGGFLVRLLVTSGGSSSVMELSRIERSDLPGALFEIPEGYREGKSGLKDVLKW